MTCDPLMPFGQFRLDQDHRHRHVRRRLSHRVLEEASDSLETFVVQRVVQVRDQRAPAFDRPQQLMICDRLGALGRATVTAGDLVSSLPELE